MQGRIFAGLFLVSLLAVGGDVAQSPSHSEKPVWTMEFINVKPGMFGLTLGYLDDNWMRVREEGKHQGAILNYLRIAEQGGSQSDGIVVLLTEFKNQATYDEREKLFESIWAQLPNKTSGVLRPHKQEDLYGTIGTRVFQDYSDTDNARLQLLAAK